MMELKKCPFCGGESYLNSHMSQDNEGYWDKHEWVVCSNCIGDNDAETWNTRPLEDAKDAEIAALKSRLERAEGVLKVYANEFNWVNPFGRKYGVTDLFVPGLNGYAIAAEYFEEVKE
jgi:hypothetical protein